MASFATKKHIFCAGLGNKEPDFQRGAKASLFLGSTQSAMKSPPCSLILCIENMLWLLSGVHSAHVQRHFPIPIYSHIPGLGCDIV